jgi:hypothetical protein
VHLNVSLNSYYMPWLSTHLTSTYFQHAEFPKLTENLDSGKSGFRFPVSGIRFLAALVWHLYLLDRTGARPFLWRAGGIFNLENDVFLIFRDYTNTGNAVFTWHVLARGDSART